MKKLLLALLLISSPVFAGKKVVYILNDELISGGTGFHVKAKSGKTFILTNKHVCAVNKGNPLKVTFKDQDRVNSTNVKTVNIVDMLEEHDLCLVEPITDDYYKIAKEAFAGEKVRVVGHPFLTPIVSSSGRIVRDDEVKFIEGRNLPEGTCKGEEHRNGNTRYCVISYPSQVITSLVLPGSSGSPVLDQRKEVVGVVFALSVGTEKNNRHGYHMVPLKYVKKILDRN